MRLIGTCQPIVMRNRIGTRSLNNMLTARHNVTEVGMLSAYAREGGTCAKECWTQWASCRPCSAEDSGTPLPIPYVGAWNTGANVVGERHLTRRQMHPFRLPSSLFCAACAASPPVIAYPPLLSCTDVGNIAENLLWSAECDIVNEGQNTNCQAEGSGSFAHFYIDAAINVVRHHFLLAVCPETFPGPSPYLHLTGRACQLHWWQQYLPVLCIDNHPSPVRHALATPELDQGHSMNTCNGCVVSETCHDSSSPDAIMAKFHDESVARPPGTKNF